MAVADLWLQFQLLAAEIELPARLRGDIRNPEGSPGVASREKRLSQDAAVKTSADWEVVVVGGGPAGAAFARTFRALRPRARVLLVDRARFPRDKVCGDALTYQSVSLVREIFPELSHLVPSASATSRQVLWYPNDREVTRGGQQLEDIENKVRQLMEAGTTRYRLIVLKALPVRLFRKAPWPPFCRQLRDLDDALFLLLESRRREPPAARGNNVLSDLLAASGENGKPLGDQEIRDAVLTILLTGHETTSLAPAWALEQIIPRADVVRHITDDLHRTTGGSPPQADQLDKLKYLDAAIRESLRVRTMLPFVVRLSKSPFVAGGREYPAGVLLCPCSYLVHRREDLYPTPEKFRPERFLERKYAGHEWFPFGGGNRACVGMAFALYEMKVILSTLFAEARLAGSRSAPVRRGVNLAPDDGARMVVTGRP